MSIVASYAVCHPPLILPFVGRGEERGIAKTIESYQEVARRVVADKPDTIVITSPHSVLYSDYFHISPGVGAAGTMAQFGHPREMITVTYDQDLVAAICDQVQEVGISAGTEGERGRALDHATYIPLWFIAQELGIEDGDLSDGPFKVVRIGLSGFDALEHYRFGQCIQRAADTLGRRIVHIASGDLSHKLKEDGPYGFVPEGPQFDEQICKAFDQRDFLALLTFDPEFADKAAECGLRSFQIMAGLLDGKEVSGGLLSYEGPFGVGYGMAAYQVAEDGQVHEDRCFAEQYANRFKSEVDALKETEDIYVQLARASVESYVRNHHRLLLSEALAQLGPLPPEMLETQAGAFVSIHEHGQLRGCIGTIGPTQEDVAREILQNAVSACSQDPRFSPIREYELDELVINVDVLGAPEDIDSPDQLDVKRYGVIVTSRGRRGLLLPDLEGVDTVEDQIAIARRKAGISSVDPVQLQRFEVVRHT